MVARIGTDEAGKGDFFGYLTVGGVYADDKTADLLASHGVKDSKRLSDRQVFILEEFVKKTCAYEVVKISPEKYNQLYAKLGNLNTLLGWAHARVIENLLNKVDCSLVVSDQFGDKNFLEERLMEKGRKVKLVQKTHAESDIAVAAASILARAEFLRTLEGLSNYSGFRLPKGATNVVDTARKISKKHGREFLSKVAKTHFKTMEEV
ncbi:MAG: ribonuclease HIII [Candidatus Altiarchaeales archaeon]|nr:ribonuclease HIII [Candidatus Altiarchaeales archaeon]